MAAKRGPSEVVSTADVEGVAVYDGEGHKLGRVDHLMIDKATGHVRSVVLVVQGFLGIGHTHMELPWSELQYDRNRHAFRTMRTAAKD
jgi:sporulation protein YlmC with PRC-barrel domain